MKAKVSGTKKKINGTTFLLMITILLFVVMYAAGMIVFNDKGFAKPQMFLNLFISNAGLLVIAMGETIVMITAGIDISVGSADGICGYFCLEETTCESTELPVGGFCMQGAPKCIARQKRNQNDQQTTGKDQKNFFPVFKN